MRQPTTAEHIQDDCQVEKAILPCRHLRAVGDPQLVGRPGGKRAPNQVGGRLGRRVALRGGERASAMAACQSGLTHQTRHVLARHVLAPTVDPPARQVRLHARHAVRAAARLVNRGNLPTQRSVSRCARRWRTLAPRPVAPGGDTQQTAELNNPMMGPRALDELVSDDRIAPVSCATKAAAVFRISRSSRSIRFSRRKRRSSSCSSLLRPSLR